MNKLLSLTIMVSVLSVFGVGAMERSEGAAYPQLTQQEFDAQLRQQREARTREAREQMRLEREQQRRGARRNLNPELELYDPNRGEGAYPVDPNL